MINSICGKQGYWENNIYTSLQEEMSHGGGSPFFRHHLTQIAKNRFPFGVRATCIEHPRFSTLPFLMTIIMIKITFTEFL